MQKFRKISMGMLAVAIALVGVSCEANRSEESLAAGSQRAEEYVSAGDYNAMVAAKNANEDTLYQTIDEIDQQLRSVSENHGLVVAAGGEHLSRRELILRTIGEINALLEQNKQRIKKLNGQLAVMRKQQKGWDQEANELRAGIVQAESELAGAQQQLAEQSATINYLNQLVNELKHENTVVSGNLKKLDAEHHTAYYALGSYRELKEKNVLEKTGGILGLGRTAQIKNEIEKTHFTEIDTRQVTTIPVHSKKAKLVTHHPVGSYEWELSESGNAEALTIKDPDKFWATSRYLVVEVK